MAKNSTEAREERLWRIHHKLFLKEITRLVTGLLRWPRLLLIEMAKDGTRRKKGKSHVTKTLEELGITRNQASEWTQLASMPAEQFEASLPVATGKKTSVREIAGQMKPPAMTTLARSGARRRT